MISLGLNRCWMQFGLSCFTMHDQWLPPPVPAPFVPGLIEGPAFMGWPPGTVSHKAGAKTYYDGGNAIQQGHDVGYLIPHFAMPMNVMMGINMLVSKHKVMFPINKVLIEGKPMGTYLIAYLGLICCNPVSLPTGVLIALRCTVLTEMTWLDFFLGLAFIAVDMLIDAIWSLVLKGDKWGKFKLPFGPFPAWYKRMLTRIFDKTVFGKFGEIGLRELIRQVGFGPIVRAILRNTGSKVLDHITKSWVVSPLISGTGFQLAQPAIGVPRSNLPGITVGRGNRAKYTFFPGSNSGSSGSNN